ncbi:unknown [Clostridium sp. CAG:230]|nr:unknown [Clostridium sp. CAG:230]
MMPFLRHGHGSYPEAYRYFPTQKPIHARPYLLRSVYQDFEKQILSWHFAYIVTLLLNLFHNKESCHFFDLPAAKKSLTVEVMYFFHFRLLHRSHKNRLLQLPDQYLTIPPYLRRNNESLTFSVLLSSHQSSFASFMHSRYLLNENFRDRF